MLVELGGGTNPHPRADVIIDLTKPKNSPAQDATVTPWMYRTPYVQNIPSDSVDEIYSSHFMEHIPKGQPLISLMNEAWRVLKPGGSYTTVFPVIGYTDPHTGEPMSDHIGWQPWADPTHVSQWWMPESVAYFCDGPFKPCADYGLQTWAPLGGYVEEPCATPTLMKSLLEPTPLYAPSYWTTRNGWEAVVRIHKP